MKILNKSHFIFFYLVLRVECYASKKTLLKSFKQCFNGSDLPIVLKDSSVRQQNKNYYYLDANFVIKYDMPKKWTLKMNYYKCTDSQILDSCQMYMDKLKVDDGCTVMNIMFERYDLLFSGINPRLECPFKAGNYSIENTLLNLYLEGILIRVPTLTIIIRAEGFEGGKKLFCVDAKIDVINRIVYQA